LQLGLLQEAEVLLNQVPESEPEGYLVAQMLSCRYTSMDSLSEIAFFGSHKSIDALDLASS
jgi:hypothetical protein